MKTFLFILFVGSAGYLPVTAQPINTDSLGNGLTNSRWLYSSFIRGKITFRDGTIAMAPMNYNLLLGDIEFISPNKDTMAIADEASIRFAAIDTDTFYYDKMYLQVISSTTGLKLAKHEAVRLTDTKRHGAFGTTTDAPGVTYYSTISRDEGTLHFNDPQEKVYKKVTTYYIGDSYNYFMPLTKRNLMKLVDKNKSSVTTYLDSNQVDFSKEEDLKKLFAYLAGEHYHL